MEELYFGSARITVKVVILTEDSLYCAIASHFFVDLVQPLH
jgi:hypothetical protein